MTGVKEIKIIAVCEIITGIAMALFWAGFYTIGLAPVNSPACYFVFKNTLPLADSVLVLTLLAGGTMLLKNIALGRTLSLFSSGGMIFLTLVDVAFNAQNGIYAISPGDLIINCLFILLGAVIMVKFRNK